MICMCRIPHLQTTQGAYCPCGCGKIGGRFSSPFLRHGWVFQPYSLSLASAHRTWGVCVCVSNWPWPLSNSSSSCSAGGTPGPWGASTTVWAASSALVGENCGKPVQKEKGQEVPRRVPGTSQEWLCLGSSVWTAQRVVAALKQGLGEQAGFSQLQVCTGGHRSLPGCSGARSHGRCFITTLGNPHHSQRPGPVADEDPEARRGRVVLGPGLDRLSLCVALGHCARGPWTEALEPWGRGDQGSFPSSTRVSTAATSP